MRYFGNQPNLTNAIHEVLDPETFPSDSVKPMSIVITASKPENHLEIRQAMELSRSIGHRVLFMVIGSDFNKDNIPGLFQGFKLVKVPHWDRLPEYLYHLINFVKTTP